MRSGPQFSAGGRRPANFGQVEYRLARDAIIRDYQRGRLSRIDICDAQTELLRVAQHLGHPTDTECPICEEVNLVHVFFAFGPHLPPSGRALESTTEARRLVRGSGEVACYVIEVCTTCSWNHLVRQFNETASRKVVAH